MVSWTRIPGLILLSGGMLTVVLSSELGAATSATLDILSDDRNAQAAGIVELGNLKPRAGPDGAVSKPPPGGNPLWAVPLSVLTATQERPIFLASRRPPRPAVVALPAVQPPPAQKAVESERLTLALIGAVVGGGDAIAIFFDRASQKIVRLRQGETHAGWVLNSVLQREVTLNKADRTEILAFQRPDGPAGVPGVPGPIPGAGGVDVSYAPFVPRSTPKNGEADGL
jgi:general secretion pathway protein N